MAIPARVVKIEGEWAEVDIGGIRREASLSLVMDRGIAIGDYVLVHTGYAITKVDEEEARSILETWKQVMVAEKEMQL